MRYVLGAQRESVRCLEDPCPCPLAFTAWSSVHPTPRGGAASAGAVTRLTLTTGCAGDFVSHQPLF